MALGICYCRFLGGGWGLMSEEPRNGLKVRSGRAYPRVPELQGYLAHKKQRPPRTLQ